MARPLPIPVDRYTVISLHPPILEYRYQTTEQVAAITGCDPDELGYCIEEYGVLDTDEYHVEAE